MMLVAADPYQALKEAVVVVLCQNEAEVKFPMDIHYQSHSKFCGWDVVVNIHLKLYFCLILAEGHNYCSF